jgi:LysR family cys regulon transcriptional activator
VFSLQGPSSLQEQFAAAGLNPNIALTARDADVIKTYVRLGMGIGIVADVAMDARTDSDLFSIDASHLFPVHTTWVGFMRGSLLRGYMYDFLQMLAPHLTRRLVERAAAAATQAEVDALFGQEKLPLH